MILAIVALLAVLALIFFLARTKSNPNPVASSPSPVKVEPTVRSTAAKPTPRAIPKDPLQGPLINDAPQFAAWEVTYEYPDTSKAESSAPPVARGGRIQQIIVTKTLPNRCIATIDESGRKLVRWCVGTTQYAYPPGATTPFRSQPGIPGDPFYITIKRDFDGFQWISKKNFVGIKNMAGRDCLAFQANTAIASVEPEKKSDPEGDFNRKVTMDAMIKANPNSQPQAPASSPQQSAPASTISEAYIDLETRLPVLLRLPDQVRTYKVLPAPTAMLPLPPEVVKIEEEVANYQKQFSQPPLRPY